MPGFNDFLSRIQADHEFYLQFRRTPQEVMAGYQLTSEQRDVLIEAGPQLWARLQQDVSDAGSAGTDADTGSGAPLEPIIRSTQVGLLPIHQGKTTDSDLNPEQMLRKPEVQQALVQIRSANTHADRLAAVFALMERLDERN
ncbi:MAG TPA: hypothetical protein VE242_15240 [Chthoniobacterales bacterium]|nr:hypothetical protein [Chthoniobacterales bacterium]